MRKQVQTQTEQIDSNEEEIKELKEEVKALKLKLMKDTKMKSTQTCQTKESKVIQTE